MNLYQKVLVRLYEETGGKDSRAVDFRELVKEMGFLATYPDIFKQMSGQGWIAETKRADQVCITHWGVKEAKKVESGTAGVSEQTRVINREIKALKSDVKQFSIMLGEFSGDKTDENFKVLEAAFNKLKNSIEKIKENI